MNFSQSGDRPERERDPALRDDPLQSRLAGVFLPQSWLGRPKVKAPSAHCRNRSDSDIAILRDNAHLAAEPEIIGYNSLSKVAHSDDLGIRNYFIFVPVVRLYPKRNPRMMKIAFAVAIAAAVLTPAPLLVGTIPAEAQTLRMAQGVDVQIGRDRDRPRRNDSDVTVGIGSGGVTVGPRQNCRMVTTTVERSDGRSITRKERRCD